MQRRKHILIDAALLGFVSECVDSLRDHSQILWWGGRRSGRVTLFDPPPIGCTIPKTFLTPCISRITILSDVMPLEQVMAIYMNVRKAAQCFLDRFFGVTLSDGSLFFSRNNDPSGFGITTLLMFLDRFLGVTALFQRVAIFFRKNDPLE